VALFTVATEFVEVVSILTFKTDSSLDWAGLVALSTVWDTVFSTKGSTFTIGIVAVIGFSALVAVPCGRVKASITSYTT
jgi:hypothetical protein